MKIEVETQTLILLIALILSVWQYMLYIF